MREIQSPETSGKPVVCVRGPGGLRWFDGGKGLYWSCRSTPFVLKVTVNPAGMAYLVFRLRKKTLKSELQPGLQEAFRRGAALVREARGLLPRPLDTVRRKP